MVIITDANGNPVEIAGSLTLNNVVGSSEGGSGGATIDPTILNTYLPLSAGSSKKLTGTLYADVSGIVVGTSNGANNNLGIMFGSSDSQTRIGGASSGAIGLYATNGIYLKPDVVNDGSGGIKIAVSDISPVITKGLSLGTSSLQWNNLYANAIYQNGKQVANKEEINTKSTVVISEWSK